MSKVFVIMLRAIGLAALASLLGCTPAQAGQQQYEPLADSVRTSMSAALARAGPLQPAYDSSAHRRDWLDQMSARLPRRWHPEAERRVVFLEMVRYEAQRAGLEPELVLGLIQVESNFRQYAVSSAGARGLMQVMPFWTELLAAADESVLFDLRANLRYGCTILRHYVDIERGDLFRALGRYNGSLGRAKYPDAVRRAWRRWRYVPAVPRGTAALRQAGRG